MSVTIWKQGNQETKTGKPEKPDSGKLGKPETGKMKKTVIQ